MPVVAFLGILAGAMAAPVSSTEEAAARVRPGTVVAWPGDGIERCRVGDETIDPLGGRCLYPIDLLAPEGPLELVRWRGGSRESITVEVGDYPYSVERITIEDESKVHLSPEDLERVEREAARIARLWERAGPRRFELPLGKPLEELPVGGRFGARRFINDEPRSPHSGTDFPASPGTSVRSVADGTVVLAAEHFFAGRSIFVDHGDGLVSMYFHLSEIDVEEGQVVSRGDRVGTVGSSGRATGPHLHFGLRWRGARIDPLPLLEGSEGLSTVAGR